MLARVAFALQQVGVVRQTESAALKAAGSNKYAPFVRKLSALYTPATLDAGETETGGMESSNREALDEDGKRSQSSSFLLAVMDEV